MNPYYQYFLASGGSLGVSDSGVIADETVVASPIVESSGVGTISTPPTPVSTVSTPPIVEPSGTATATTNPISSPEPTTTIGDTGVGISGGGQNPSTTINIFGAGTTTTTGAGQVAIDPNFGISTSTTDPNAAISPESGGGGGGGGFGGGGIGGDEEGQAGEAPIIRTILPLLVIAGGIAVFILKPFKK